MHKIKNSIKTKITTLKRASTLKGIKHNKDTLNEDFPVELTFRLKKTQEDFPNESIHICGSLPELGGNSADRSPVMRKEEDGHWVYSITIPLASLEKKRKELANTFEGNPSGFFFTFNYIAISNDNGRSTMKYEEIPKRGLLKAPLLKETSLDKSLVSSIDSNESYRDHVILEQEWNVNDEIVPVKPEIPIPETESTSTNPEVLKGKEASRNDMMSPILSNDNLVDLPSENATAGDTTVHTHINLGSSGGSWLNIEDTEVPSESSLNSNITPTAFVATAPTNIPTTTTTITTTTSTSSGISPKDKVFDWYYGITGKENKRENFIESAEERKLRKDDKKKLKQSIKGLKEEQKLKEKEEKKQKKLTKMRNSQENLPVILDKNTTIPSTVNYDEVNQVASEPRPISNEGLVINVFQNDLPSNVQVQIIKDEVTSADSEPASVESIREMEFIPIPRERSLSKEEIRENEQVCDKRRKEEAVKIFNSQLHEKTNYDTLRNSSDDIKMDFIEHSVSYETEQQPLTPQAEKKEYNLDVDVVVPPVDQDKIVYHTESTTDKVTDSEAMMERNIENLVSEFAFTPQTPILEKDECVVSNQLEEVPKLRNKDLSMLQKDTITRVDSGELYRLEKESIEALKSVEMNPNFNVESTPLVRQTNAKEFNSSSALQYSPNINQLPIPFTTKSKELEAVTQSKSDSGSYDSSAYTLLSYEDINAIKMNEEAISEFSKVVQEEENEQVETERQLREVEELLEETQPLLLEDREEQAEQEQEDIVEKEMEKEDFFLKKDEVETERLLNRSNQVIQDTEDLIAVKDSLETDIQLVEAEEAMVEGQQAIESKVHSLEEKSISLLEESISAPLANLLEPDTTDEVDPSQVHFTNESSFSEKPSPITERIHDDLENKMEKAIEASGILEEETKSVVTEPQPDVIELVDHEEKMVSVFEEESTKGKESLRRSVKLTREPSVEEEMKEVKEEFKQRFETKSETRFEDALLPMVNVTNKLSAFKLTQTSIVVFLLVLSLLYTFALPESFLLQVNQK